MLLISKKTLVIIVSAILTNITYANVELNKCIIQATPAGQKTTPFFAKIKSDRIDMIEDVIFSKSGKIQMLEGNNNPDDISELSPVSELRIKKGVSLIRKGGQRIMFTNLNSKIESGETYDVTLVFQNAGEVSCKAKGKLAARILQDQSDNNN